LNYVEYLLILKHRESWQNVGAMLTSKAEVNSFCLELSKKLDMRYVSPAMPVDLALVKRPGNDSDSTVGKLIGMGIEDNPAIHDVAALFDKNQ
jgi:hypothetical protein